MTRAFAALQDEQRDFDLRPWLFRIAHNEAISILRRRRADGRARRRPGARASSRTGSPSARSCGCCSSTSPTCPSASAPRSSCASSTGSATPRSATCSSSRRRAVKQAIFEARSALFSCREGREMACHDVRRMLSDGDGRVLRGRGVRAHLRTCPDCRRFRADLEQRPRALRALAPPLPVGSAAALLAQLIGGGTAAKLLACVAIVGGGGATLAVEMQHARDARAGRRGAPRAAPKREAPARAVRRRPRARRPSSRRRASRASRAKPPKRRARRAEREGRRARRDARGGRQDRARAPAPGLPRRYARAPAKRRGQAREAGQAREGRARSSLRSPPRQLKPAKPVEAAEAREAGEGRPSRDEAAEARASAQPGAAERPEKPRQGQAGQAKPRATEPELCATSAASRRCLRQMASAVWVTAGAPLQSRRRLARLVLVAGRRLHARDAARAHPGGTEHAGHRRAVGSPGRRRRAPSARWAIRELRIEGATPGALYEVHDPGARPPAAVAHAADASSRPRA